MSPIVGVVIAVAGLGGVSPVDLVTSAAWDYIIGALA